MIERALIRVRIADQRLYAMPEAIRLSNRRSDRQSLATNIESVQLELSIVIELLRDALGMTE